MIDFRYHVVSIVAVFLALTVGLVLGASFLKGAAVQNLNDSINSLTTQRNNLQQSDRTLNNQISQLNSYISNTAAIAVQGYLNGYDVAVVQLTGSDPTLTTDTLAYLADAGAKVTSDIVINASFTATDTPTQTKLSAAVTSNTPSGQTPASGPPAIQAADLLAQAITAAVPVPNLNGTVTPPATGMTQGEAQSVVAAFSTGGFISAVVVPDNLKPAVAAKPTLAFIVAPTTANTPPENAAYLAMAEALRADGAGPVVGGAAENSSSGSSQSGGLLDAVLKDSTANKQVATVDNMNLVTGQVAVVFTLYQVGLNALAGTNAPAGHYGTVGFNDGQLPPLSALPTPPPTVTPTGTTTPGGTATP